MKLLVMFNVDIESVATGVAVMYEMTNNDYPSCWSTRAGLLDLLKQDLSPPGVEQDTCPTVI